MAAKRKENAVINHHLIVNALEDAESVIPVETSLPRPPVNVEAASALQLSFRNLLKIENLTLLTKLQKLQLDNNLIGKIEGLECLPHLQWLDLSFNRISKIENLSHLKSLHDLSLFSNEIRVVEGLDSLTSLQCLSLGNNLIPQLESVLYFRKLPALEALTLEGNPCCKPSEGSRDNYAVYVHAFLPKLRYLDYRLITAAEKMAARDGGVPAEKLAEVEEKGAQEEKAAAAKHARDKLIQQLAEQNLDMAASFPGEIFEDEPEFVKLRAMGMPGLEPLMKALEEALVEPSTALKELGGEKDARIKAEIAMFGEAVAETTGEAFGEAQKAVDAWETELKVAVREVKGKRAEGGSVAPVMELARQHILRLHASAEGLYESLLRREMTCHESIEGMLDIFDSAMGELRAAKLALHDAFFRALEGQVSLFTEGLSKHGEKLMSESEAGKLPAGLDEELLALLGDKEALVGSLSQSAETRVARILKRETEMRVREDQRCSGAVQGARKGELARNRARVLELKALTSACKKRAESDLLQAAK